MSQQEESVHREYGSVEENALRIPVDKAEQIIDALNADLADTYVLYHQPANTTGTSPVPSSSNFTSSSATPPTTPRRAPTKSPSDSRPSVARPPPGSTSYRRPRR